MYLYNPTFSDPDSILRNAFHHCSSLAIAGRHMHMTLAIPAKGNLDGLISKYIGEEATRILLRDNKINLGKVTLHLATNRIPVRFRGPVLAAFTTIDHIKTLSKMRNVSDLMYIPWQEDELPAFRKLFPEAQPIPESLMHAQ